MPFVTPTQSNAQAALAAFLGAVLPGVQGQQSAVFSATISGNSMTVTKMIVGTIAVGSVLLGAAPGTTITGFTSGKNGGVGVYTVSPSQAVSNSATMACGVAVVSGQQNRAAEPANPFFVVFTPIRFERLSTNVDSAQDVKFVGSITGTTMTVSSIDQGEIVAGATVYGAGVASGTTVVSFGTGTGGVGTYQVSQNQNVGSETLSAGWKVMTEDARVTVQVDFHSSDTTAGDFAQTVSTALRDEYGVDFFANLAAPLNGVVPLHADDPVQRPFINGEGQYEWRWSLDVHLEVSQSVVVAQTYADSAAATLVEANAASP